MVLGIYPDTNVAYLPSSWSSTSLSVWVKVTLSPWPMSTLSNTRVFHSPELSQVYTSELCSQSVRSDVQVPGHHSVWAWWVQPHHLSVNPQSHPTPPTVTSVRGTLTDCIWYVSFWVYTWVEAGTRCQLETQAGVGVALMHVGPLWPSLPPGGAQTPACPLAPC